MISLLDYAADPAPCAYLPGRTATLHYRIVEQATAAEYARLLRTGWRRFGHRLFRPQCPACQACRSLRVDARTFVASKSQKRAWNLNTGAVELTIGPPSTSVEKLELYDRFHAAQAERKNWPDHGTKDWDDYESSFVENPFPVEEWCYRLDGELVGVGYVDPVPDGLSAVYFFHDPEKRDRSLGTWNVMNVIAAAGRRGLKYAYLGLFVRGYGSLEYKARFRPNEILDEDADSGRWEPFNETV